MEKRISINIFGQVQGVGVRYSISRRAQELNLTGWVRNEKDGTVLALVEGEEKDLFSFIDYCKNGLKFAKVINVDVEWICATGKFKEFEIKY